MDKTFLQVVFYLLDRVNVKKSLKSHKTEKLDR